MKIISIIEKKEAIHKGFNTIRRKKERYKKDVVVYEEKGTGSQSGQAWRLRKIQKTKVRRQRGSILRQSIPPPPLWAIQKKTFRDT